MFKIITQWPVDWYWLILFLFLYIAGAYLKGWLKMQMAKHQKISIFIPLLSVALKSGSLLAIAVIIIYNIANKTETIIPLEQIPKFLGV